MPDHKHYDGNQEDVWLVKVDSEGNQEWDKIFGGDLSEIGKSVLQTCDAGYLIAGSTKSYGNGNFDTWLIKTDLSGNEIWTKTYGGIDDDVANSIDFTHDGGYVITGYTRSYGNGQEDIWLIKTTPDESVNPIPEIDIIEDQETLEDAPIIVNIITNSSICF